jgi:hypothetical protein
MKQRSIRRAAVAVSPPGTGDVRDAEIRFLLAACSVADHCAAPPRPEDRGRLSRLAWFHRVSPLVYEHRERLGLTDEEAALYRKAALETLHRNLQLAAELRIALRALVSADVPVILLKGAQLMDAVYHNLALRPMSDLDLLVRPEGAAKAVVALSDAGFHADGRKAGFTDRADREIRLEKSGVHKLAIELHTSLNRPTRHHWFPMELLWERSVVWDAEGAPARALCPEDNLVFLCAHAVPHVFAQLIWLRDIAGLMAQGMDGGALRSAARAAHAVRAVQAGVTLAHALMDGPLPDGFGASPLPVPNIAFGRMHYSTLASLRLRAALSDHPFDAAGILAAVTARKLCEIAGGQLVRKVDETWAAGDR